MDQLKTPFFEGLSKASNPRAVNATVSPTVAANSAADIVILVTGPAVTVTGIVADLDSEPTVPVTWIELTIGTLPAVKVTIALSVALNEPTRGCPTVHSIPVTGTSTPVSLYPRTESATEVC